MNSPYSESLKEVQRILIQRLGGVDPDRIVMVGVGNRMLGDDAFGPLLIDLLQDVSSRCLDAGVVPEEYTSQIKRMNPHAIIFLDAIDHGGIPGEIRIIEPDQILSARESSHILPLNLIMEFLKEETCADVFLIGVQYHDISPESGLSPEMEHALQRCVDLIGAMIRICLENTSESLGN